MNRSFAVLIALLACLLAAPAVAGPPPGGRPDPRQMSGIPRVDPQLAAGTVTVRVLEGGFDAPSVGAEVTLKLTKGETTETKTAKAVAQGRATFAGLDAFIGGTAVASVQFGEEVVSSMGIKLAPAAGSRVMLVKGAKPAAMGTGAGPATGPAAGSPHGGGADMPLPGAPFPLKDRPAGSLIVGALDLDAKTPIEGVEVILQIRDPEAGEDAAPMTRKATSDDNGRAKFDNLLPPELPEEAEITVLAALAEGEPPTRSQTFTMPAEGGLALVLTTGTSDTAKAGAGAGAGPAQPGLTPIPPPQMDPSIAPGTVKVLLLDGRDRPVVDQTVNVVRKDVSGQELRFRGTTDKNGIATVEDIALNPESFYFVGVVYDGGPYQSGFFQLPDTMGARVPMRVYATTADRGRIRSAVQYEFRSMENDQVQVIQLYELFVDGDEAYWPGSDAASELRIAGMEGAKFLQVLPRSEGLLDQPSDSAPYARLIEPIPPGDVEHLSIAYVLEHDGSIELDWQPPFPIVQGAAVVQSPIVVRDANGKELTREEAPHAQTDDGRPLSVYQLPVGDAAGGNSHISLQVTGLASRDRWPQRTALIGSAILSILVLVAFLVRPRLGVRASLVARRDSLMQELERLGPDAPAAQREAIVTALDQVYRKLEALESR